MIRVVLFGRTGNNLFQYALGRVLARRHGVPLVLGAHWYDGAGWREVGSFVKRAPGAGYARFPSLWWRLRRKLGGTHPWERGHGVVLREDERTHAFDPRFLEAPEDCVLWGYFQSPLYFAECGDALRNELMDCFGTGGGLAAGGGGQPVVAVHVRRGDYALHPDLQVCGMDYYERAMEKMRNDVPGAVFDVFSDEPEWCARHFRQPDVRVRTREAAAAEPMEEMLAMSRASHHIIANSSFSWWAAWFGKKAGQRVLAPDRWFNGGVEAPIKEKLLPGWETL